MLDAALATSTCADSMAIHNRESDNQFSVIAAAAWFCVGILKQLLRGFVLFIVLAWFGVSLLKQLLIGFVVVFVF